MLSPRWNHGLLHVAWQPCQQYGLCLIVSILSLSKEQKTRNDGVCVYGLKHPRLQVFLRWVDIGTVRLDSPSPFHCICDQFRVYSGSISLLVKTNLDSSSSAYGELLRSIVSNLNSTAIGNDYLNVHILSTNASSSSYSPNAYLNLARIFAISDNVLLFPGNGLALRKFFLNASLPAHLFNTITSDAESSNQPTIISSSNIAKYTFKDQPLAPIAMPRDYAVWCTERGFITPTRNSDWEQCLIQLWMDRFGEMKHAAISEWNDEELSDANVIAVREHVVAFCIVERLNNCSRCR